MPVFGLGTWRLGGRIEHDPGNDDEADIRAIRRAIDHGVTHIDTAEIYASGHSERLVASAIEGHDREKLFIVSKVWHTNLRKKDVLAAARGSLERLGTDYLDLYLVHIPNPEVDMKETFSALDELVDAGAVRNIGVSNFTVERMKRAQDIARHPIRATQCHYNLRFREVEQAGVLQYCRDNDLLFIAWRPLQFGELTAQEELERAPVLREMCDKYGKTPAQIAINWLVSQPAVITLSTMRSPDHLRENLTALDWRMAEEDVERLRREYPGQELVSNSVRLQ